MPLVTLQQNPWPGGIIWGIICKMEGGARGCSGGVMGVKLGNSRSSVAVYD